MVGVWEIISRYQQFSPSSLQKTFQLKDYFSKITFPPQLKGVALFSYRCTKFTVLNLSQYKKQFCILLLFVLWYDLFMYVLAAWGKRLLVWYFRGGVPHNF